MTTRQAALDRQRSGKVRALFDLLRPFALGSLSVLAFQPWGWWFILPLVYGGLLAELSWGGIHAVAGREWRGAFRIGWLFAFGQFVFGLMWMNEALLVDAAMHGWLIPFSATLIPGGLALFQAIAVAVVWRLVPVRFDLSPFSRQLALALVLTVALSAAEWLRGHVLTGLPWNLRASVWLDVLPVAQLSSVIGPWGLGALTLFWALAGGMLLLLFWFKRTGALTGRLVVHPFLLMSLFFLLVAVWGQQRIDMINQSAASDIGYRIVQPNIAQREKWVPEKRFDHIIKTAALSWPLPNEEDSRDKEVIIWPETAVPYLWTPGDRVDVYVGAVPRPGQILVSGIPRVEDVNGRRLAYNSIVRWQNGQSDLLYDKKHLVPFGEYVPFPDLLRKVGLGPLVRGAFSEGAGPGVVDIGYGLTALPLICYEIIFPGAVASRAADADFILNVTNDGWFGTSAGPWQHAAAVQMRAIETGKPVLRAANTGISMVVKPNGKIYQKAYIGEEVSIIGRFNKSNLPETIYVVWGDLGFLMILVFFSVLSFLLFRKHSV